MYRRRRGRAGRRSACARQARQLRAGLTGLNVFGADLVEGAPGLDPTAVTTITAATLALDLAHLLAKGRSKGCPARGWRGGQRFVEVRRVPRPSRPQLTRAHMAHCNYRDGFEHLGFASLCGLTPSCRAALV
jgi:hypothetical protein